MLHSICRHIWKTQQWPWDWKRSVFIPIQKKGHAKNVQTATQLHSSHMLTKRCSKLSKWGFNSMWTKNFQMFKVDLEKAEEPEIKLPTSTGSQKKTREFQKNVYFCFIDYIKAFDCGSQQTGKFLKRWENQTTLPASWGTCMQVKRQQNGTWTNKLVQIWESIMSSLYTVTKLI